MSVPFIDLKRFEPGFLDAWNEKVSGMTRNAQFIGGAEVSGLEKTLSESTGTANAVTCANGTDAIQLALRALNIGPGDRVLIPDLTFWATYEAVVNVGATPCTVDISFDDLGMDVDAVAECLKRNRPAAVIAVHLYGWGSRRLQELRRMCESAGVALIEDGAQCFGAEYNGRSIYADAAVATVSFYPAKVLGAAGDGGAALCRDPAIADRVRMLSNHGRTSHYGHGDVGWNSRLDALQAAYLNMSFQHLSARLESRRYWARRYQEELPRLGIEVVRPPECYKENGYCNVNLIRNPELKRRMESLLKEAGIGFGNIYPGAISDQPGSAKDRGDHFGGKNAAKVCAAVLNLPLFPYMTDAEYAEVISVVGRATGHK